MPDYQDPDRGIMRACKNKQDDCAISTGICETTTRGRGELDENGYWEIPCHDCPLRPPPETRK